MSEHTDALNAMDGIPASVGVVEPIEGYRYRPHDAVKAMQEMATNLTTAQAENEALRARVEHLRQTGNRVINYGAPHSEWIEAIDVCKSSEAWLLRKQAEAVEDYGKYLSIARDGFEQMTPEQYAQRLRQQADELEQNQ